MLLQGIGEFNQGFIAINSTTRLLQTESILNEYEVHMCATKPGKIGKSKDLCRKYQNNKSYPTFCLAFEFEMPVNKTNVDGYMFAVKYTKACVGSEEAPKDLEETVMEKP
jgi:hypothetical protein